MSAPLRVVADDPLRFSSDQVGRLLLESGADLGDPDACLEALIAAGVRPWQVEGSLLEARIAAQNLGAQRYWMRRSLKHPGDIMALLGVVLGSVLLLAGSSSPAEALERLPPHGSDDFLGLMLALFAAVALFGLGLYLATADHDDEEDW